MEVIKKKILLEKYISRQRESYGRFTTSNIDVQIYLTQSYEDTGLYSNASYSPYSDNYSGDYKLKREDVLVPRNFDPLIHGRHPLINKDRYDNEPTNVVGMMDDRYLNSVGSYQIDENNKPLYQPNLNMSNDIKKSYNGVLSVDDNQIRYVIGGQPYSDGQLLKPNTGVMFTTNFNEIIEDFYSGREWKETIFSHNMGGLRTTENGGLPPNTGLYAIYQREEFLDTIETPKVRDEVFIKRGVEDIFERHAIMSEIKTRNDIDEYRDGYF